MVFGRKLDQQYRDMQRKTYVLSFPAEMTHDMVVAWLRAISGMPKGGGLRSTGLPTIAFELWSTTEGKRWRLKLPWQEAEDILPQLRHSVPGIRVDHEEEWPSRSWTRAIEIGFTHSSRQLRIPVPESLSHSLLSSVGHVKQNETIMVQWVIKPLVNQRPPELHRTPSDQMSVRMLVDGNLAGRDEVKDRRAKLEDVNFEAVARVGAVAETPTRAAFLLSSVVKSLKQVETHAVHVEHRPSVPSQLQHRLDLGTTPMRFGMQLSAPELAALLAWPVGNPLIPGMPMRLSRQLPAPASVPRDGLVLGRSNFPGDERKVALAYADATKHLHLVGPTGSGKTVLLSQLIRQDMEQGYGVVLVESKGDLFHAALDYVPKERLGDVIVLDVNDTRDPVGFNILEQGDPSIVIDELIALFRVMFKDHPSLWAKEVLYYGLQTLMTIPGATFTDLRSLVMPLAAERDWQQDVTRNLKDPELRAWWQERDGMARAKQDQMTQPLLDRIWELNRPKLRNILGQSTSSFKMSDVFNQNKILLVNLAGVEADTAAIMGSLIINTLWSAAKHNRSETPTFLTLDEFQKFLNLPIDPQDMLQQARSFNLGLRLAHQHLGQLSNEMKRALSANARSKVVFPLNSSEDARELARDFGPSVTEHDFMGLGPFETITRTATGGSTSPPYTMTTIEPERGNGQSGEVLYTSRKAYGRPVADVEEQIAQRRSVTKAETKRRRPPISGYEQSPP